MKTKTRTSSPSPFRLCLVLCSALAAVPVLAQPPTPGAGFEAMMLPVPVDIDGERVASSMYFSVPAVSYGEAATAEMAQKNLDPVERTYLQLLQGLAADDPQKAGPAIVGGETPGGAAQKTDLWRTAFGGMDATRTVARLDLGASQLFVWDWPSPKGLQRRAFAFDTATLRGDLVTSHNPLGTLLLDVFQRQVEDPAAYAPAADVDTRYAYPLPLGGGARVSWHFDGEPLDYDLYGADAPPRSAPALVALRAAHRKLAEGDVEGYLAAHTPVSRAKLAGWIAKMSPQEKLSFEYTTLLDKQVRFVLDADPVHIIFYHFDLKPGTASGEAVSSTDNRYLSWYFVHRDPASGNFLLANAYRQGFIDDFLGDEDLIPRTPGPFTERVLGLSR